MKALDRIFLWVPHEESPGVLAVGLFLLRQITLPFVLMLTPFLILASFAPSNFNPLSQSLTMTNGLNLSVAAFVFGCIALVQELGRYGFVRRARDRLRAISVFTAVIIGGILMFDHNRLYTCAWMIAAQLAASAALVWALGQRLPIVAVMASLIVAQTAIDVTAPQFFRPNAAAAKPNSGQIPRPLSGATSQIGASPTTDADLPPWARLYPGAALRSHETHKLMGLTDWKVAYSVQASPEQIGDFYQTLADAEGFTDRQTLLGFHRFRQTATGSDFSYFVTAGAAGTDVVFEARAFAADGSAPK